MNKKFLVQIVGAVVLAAGGVASFFTIVPVTTVDLSRLSSLVITNPKVPNIAAKATYSAPTSVASSQLPVLSAGYLISPGETGEYTTQWFGLGSKGGNVGVFLELLPNVGLAKTAAAQQVSTRMTTSALTSIGYNFKSNFTVPGVASGPAVYYLIPRQATKSSSGAEIPQTPVPGYTAEIRIGRVAARIDLDGFAATKARLISIAAAEVAAIEGGLPKLKNMASLVYPLGSSLILWAIVAVLIGLVFLIPYIVERYALSRAAREEARRRYQLQSRGAKIARRRGATRR
jgi:hypothetical protein